MNRRIPLAFCAVLLMIGCKPAQSRFSENIKVSKMVEVMMVGQFPTESRFQDPAKSYFLNHEVEEKVTLEPEAARQLLQQLEKDPNFVDGYARSCEFLPKYGIRLDSASLLLSPHPCPKIQFQSAAKQGMFDLATGNGIERILSTTFPH